MATTSQPEKLPAISVRQPWAIFIMAGFKAIEFRSKPTKMRGRFYVYASLGKSQDEADYATYELGFHPDAFDALDRGCIIGTIEVADCIDKPDGNGQYWWLLSDPEYFEEPLEVPKGVQPQPSIWYPFGKP